jgi:hypothetical protein
VVLHLAILLRGLYIRSLRIVFDIFEKRRELDESWSYEQKVPVLYGVNAVQRQPCTVSKETLDATHATLRLVI